MKTTIQEKVKDSLTEEILVGKSTLVNILRKKTQKEYSPTIFDNIYHYLNIDHRSYGRY